MSGETKPPSSAPKIRISAIDRCRGYSIFYMVLGHSIMYWLLPQEQYIVGFGIVFLEIMGANAFILISGMSMSLSYNSYVRKVQISLPENVQREKWRGRLQIWIRTVWVVVLAAITNFVGTIGTFPPIFLWVWYVLQTIWVARAVSYPFLQLPAWTRFVVGIIIFLVADPLRLWSLTAAPLLNTILFYTPDLNPFFPFVGFFFIGSAIGDWLDQWTQIKQGMKKPLEGERKSPSLLERYFTPRNLAILGLVLFGVSLLLGWQMDHSDLTAGMVERINIHPAWNIDTMPSFLVHSNTPWAFFTVGCELVIFAAFLRADLVNMKRMQLNSAPPNTEKNTAAKKTYKNSTKALTLFGQQSLTVYMAHYVVYVMLYHQLWFWQWLILGPLFTAGFHTLIWIWANGKGKGYTLEWAIGTSTDMMVKVVLKRVFPIEKKNVKT